MAKVWLITGSSRGLGRALAEAVLAAGDKLVATARKPAQLTDLVDRYGGQVRAVALEVTVARAALPVFRTQRDGHIIQISSVGGRGAKPGLSAYRSAKWAVGGFSEVLAKEVGPLGIKVTVVEPGGIRTDFSGSSMRVGAVRPDYQKTVGAMIEAQSGNADIMRGDPAKVARVILRIASEKRPPLRLLLGSDAVFLASLASAERAKEDAQWKELSLSTDFDGLADFSETPIAKMLSEKS